MGKLRVLSGKDVCKILMQNGFVEIRQKGSHIIMQKKVENSTITIPIPNHPEIKIGTLQSIIRQSKLSKERFEA
ncbi:MAG: type II toxin-antitoxin system HicA family toxin [Ignavibacteriales bacterium]|nr:type II toxin-antitoxin system HicA family toxin [Ignavibacteriales bacterium]